MKKIVVHLKERSYPVIIGRGALSSLNGLFRRLSPSHRVVAITNRPIYHLYRRRLENLISRHFKLSWIVVPDGEKYKTLETVKKIYNQMITAGADRTTPVMALGGGVVGDSAGFAAATFMRGLSYVQVPTTLLAQVDSSVGGKVGVDLTAGKNLIGSFYQPSAVVADTLFLSSLPRREYLCGLAEVVKYGILWDASFFGFMEKNIGKILRLNHNVLEALVEASVSIKAEIVSRDEREGESGLRSLLNLGHTLAHAIETLSGYRGLKHGEAVAAGLVFSATVSNALGLCPASDVKRIVVVLKKLGLPVAWPKYTRKAYARVISRDKKNRGNRINFVAIRKIGKAILKPLKVNEITEYI